MRDHHCLFWMAGKDRNRDRNRSAVGSPFKVDIARQREMARVSFAPGRPHGILYLSLRPFKNTHTESYQRVVGLELTVQGSSNLML